MADVKYNNAGEREKIERERDKGGDNVSRFAGEKVDHLCKLKSLSVHLQFDISEELAPKYS